MKKFAAVVAVAVLFAFAAPVFAATNPFMDVPMGHWAYDAIGQLAAHGILSGYPDGTYKGKQPTTRYEMASALARALAVVDMTKASKQDVEMLKKLVMEFKDELDALGVKVDALDKRVAVLEDRLGGWKLSGKLRLDIRNFDDKDSPDAENDVRMTQARIIFERWFGDEENPMHFKAILRGDSGDGEQHNLQNWKEFFVEIPFFWDSTLTVGRFGWDMEEDYYLGGSTALPATGGYAGYDAFLTGRDLDAMGWSKSFGLGNVRAYVAHDENVRGIDDGRDDPATGWVDESTVYDNWEFMVMAQLQFNEQFGFDLGAQGFWGDNAEPAAPNVVGDLSFDSLWTIFAGVRFNFTDSVAFKGIYYKQSIDADRWDGVIWRNAYPNTDDPSAFKLIVDVKQEALKFTSLWLEYGQMDRNFTVPAEIADNGALFTNSTRNFVDLDPVTNTVTRRGFGAVQWLGDLKYWRIAAGQEWNEKWATHVFYNNYEFDRRFVGDLNNDFVEWGLGVRYTYNPNVKFGLNFVKIDWDQNTWRDAAGNVIATRNDDHIIRFRTEVSF